jgi:sterol desaturase/sphingolipid hydroxylase (fatty acid hydroxylase superfamily)
VGEFFHAVRVFFDHLASVGWGALGIALAFHFAKVAVRTVAWRNIIQAAYPQTRVPLPPVFGAYVAGVGINSIAPARVGDLVKLYLVRHKIPGTTYTTLASTLFAETLVDLVLAGAIFIWALTQGVLPGLNVLPQPWWRCSCSASFGSPGGPRGTSRGSSSGSVPVSRSSATGRATCGRW